MSVITKTQLDNRGISTLADAMKTTTGVNVVNANGSYRFQSRGYYIDQIEEDGIASTVPGSATNMYQDAQSLTDLAIYDHVEVVRGATGLTQANGSPGGTVNAVRKRPTANKQIQLGIQADRFGTVRTTADASGSLNENSSLRGRAVAILERNNSFQDAADGKSGTIYGILEADAGDNTKVTLGGLLQQKSYNPPTSVLMGTDGSDLNLPRDTYLGAAWDNHKKRKTTVFGELEHYFNDHIRYTGKLSYTQNKSDLEFGTLARRNTGDASDTARIGIMSRYNGDGSQIAFHNSLTGKFHTLGRQHDWFATYSFSREKGQMHNVDAKRDATISFNLYNYQPSDFTYPDWSNMGWDGNSETLFNTHMVSAGTRFNPTDKLHILAGGSYAWFKSHYVENAYNYNTSRPYTENTLTKQRHFTPYLGLTYDITPSQSLYTSYTSIFKPSYGRLDKEGKQVDPKTGNNFEIGWKGAWLANRLNASVALFHLNERNRPMTVNTTMDPTASRSYTATIGRVRSRGWEAELSGNLTKNWKIFAGYTFNTSKYANTISTTQATGIQFSPHTPKHIFRLYSSYRLPFNQGKWEVGAGLSAQSRTSYASGSIVQGGYTLFNANVHYQPTQNLSIGLIGSNLTDKRYYQNTASRSYLAGNYYGEPRNITLKVDWKF
ncbi:MAG: TonB-dependent siderophore receptor [Neisseria sp.]|nr:TonB-dependent siderophore receptor [Neisseria sp.]